MHCACRFRSPRVSIHAPREGRDLPDISGTISASIVSIHAPREGRDVKLEKSLQSMTLFQSTRPVRGATRTTPSRNNSGLCFNPRAP